MRATWTDPHTGREDRADVTEWAIEGGWLVLDVEADRDTSGRGRPAKLLIPPTVAVRIEKDDA